MNVLFGLSATVRGGIMTNEELSYWVVELRQAPVASRVDEIAIAVSDELVRRSKGWAYGRGLRGVTIDDFADEFVSRLFSERRWLSDWDLARNPNFWGYLRGGVASSGGSHSLHS